MPHSCEYCNASFLSKRALINHQKTAKYCLDIQTDTFIQEFKCECGSEFTRKDSLKRHEKTCRMKIISLPLNTVCALEKENLVEPIQREKLDLNNIITDQLKEESDSIKTGKDEIENVAPCEDDKIVNLQLVIPGGNIITIPAKNNGSINATAICKASGKLFDNWKQTKEFQDLVSAMQSDMEIPISKLITSIKDGISLSQGAWIHPDLVIPLAQWCSPTFAIQTSRWMRELLLTAKIEIEHGKHLTIQNYQLQSLVSCISSTTSQSKHLEEELKFVESKHNLIMQSMNYQRGDNVIYIGFIGVREEKPYYKFGKSHQFDIRNNRHISTFDEFKTIFVFNCEADIAEPKIKNYLKRKGLKDNIEVNGMTKTEIFFTTADTPIEEILEVCVVICDMCKSQSQENERLRIENIEKDYRFQLEQERHKMELELEKNKIELERHKMELELAKNKIELLEAKIREMKLGAKLQKYKIDT